MIDPHALAELLLMVRREHRPTTGMKVASGETCICGYWNGEERAGVDKPLSAGMGLEWHTSQMQAEAIQRLESIIDVDSIENVLELCKDVGNHWEGYVSTHYDTCYLSHAACLAALIEAVATKKK